MTLSQNEATRFISVIDYRIERALGRGTVLEITYGDVDVVNDRYASVFIGGDTTASEGFRIPSGLRVESGDRVRVVIDPRGDRYVEEVLAPTTYAKALLDPVRGEVLLGDGSTAPDITLEHFAPGTLRIIRNDDLGQTALAIAGPSTGDEGGEISLEGAGSYDDWATDNYQGRLRWHSAGNVYLDLSSDRLAVYGGDKITFGISEDTNLYRSVGSLLKTDDTFHAVGGLRVTSPSSTDGQNFEALRIVLPNNGYTGFAIYDQPTATEPVLKYAGFGAMLFGPGGTTAPDVNLYRGGVNILKTDDNLYVGDPTGSTGIHLSPGGNIEIAGATNPFIDFKNSPTDDYDARFIYNLSGNGLMEYYGATFKFNTSVNVTGVLYQAGTQVVSARRTGWGVMTGTGARTGINLETASTAQIGNRLKSLIDDLTAHGLIGA